MLKTILEVTAPLSTYLLFVSPVPTLYDCSKKGSSDHLTPAPFLVNLLCGGLWLRYGLVTEDATVINVNMVGVGLGLLFLMVYWFYHTKKFSILVKASVAAAVYAGILYVCELAPEPVERLGLITAMVNVVAIGSPLAALGEVMRSQSTESLPFPLIFMGVLVSMQWFMYGYLINNVYMLTPNAIGLLLGFLQLSLFFIYPEKSKREKLQ